MSRGPYLNDIGHNANNANNANNGIPKSPMSFKYRYFVHSIFPLLFKNDNFKNPNLRCHLSMILIFPMSFKKGTIVSVVM